MEKDQMYKTLFFQHIGIFISDLHSDKSTYFTLVLTYTHKNKIIFHKEKYIVYCMLICNAFLFLKIVLSEIH